LALLTTLEPHRSLLWRLCYRMTGSAADADDLVQDTFERALAEPPLDQTRELGPWLIRVALNLARDRLRSRKRRGYVGPWLPAPIETDAWSVEPAADVRYSELESVSMAFLVALEALTPMQRSVLLLTDVLGYSVKEVAALLDKTESNVKTSHHRARAALARYDSARVPLTSALQEQTREALTQLMLAMQAGDVSKLSVLLSQDARTVNDSDGEFHAAQVPVLGRDRVINFHLKLRRSDVPRMAVRQINGLPALVAEFAEAAPRVARRVVLCIALDAAGRINHLNTTLASHKLTHVSFAFSD
jgi:RNA polymerase sigma factor (sigma-70 family)